MSKNHTPTRHAEEMFRVIEQFLASNLSRQEFCQQHDIRYSTLHWWLSQYRQRNGQSQHNTPSQKKFIPIELKPSATTSQPHCQIEYPNGVVLHLYGQFDARLITELVTVS